MNSSTLEAELASTACVKAVKWWRGEDRLEDPLECPKQ